MKSASIASVSTKPRAVPMHEALSIIAALFAQLEDGSSEPEAIQNVFTETRLDVAAAIDRRKAAKSLLLANAESAAAMAAYYRMCAASMKKVAKSLEQNTIDLMLELPDYPYQDSAGRKVSICESQGALKLTVPTASKKVDHIVDLETVRALGIPQQFWKTVTYVCIDTESLVPALKAGMTCSWAQLEKTKFLRGL